MKSRTLWALAGASVLLVGIVSIQQTGATWRSSADHNSAATIKAGRLDISAGNFGDGTLDLSDFGAENMTANTVVAKPVEIFNSGNVPMAYALEKIVVTAKAPATTAPDLVWRIYETDGASECASDPEAGDQITGWPNNDLGTYTRKMGVSGSEWLCLTAQLGPNAEPAQSGTAQFTFTSIVDR